MSQSEEKLVSNFLRLSQIMPLHKINVRDLCKVAGVSRTTFYRYYDSIYEVAERLEEKHIDGFMLISMQHDLQQSSLKEYMQDILEYIYSEELFFKSVLSEHSDRHFINQWKKIIYHDILKQYHLDETKISESDKIYFEMLVSGAIGAYTYWLFQKEKIPVEQMIPLLLKVWDYYKM